MNREENALRRRAAPNHDSRCRQLSTIGDWNCRHTISPPIPCWVYRGINAGVREATEQAPETVSKAGPRVSGRDGLGRDAAAPRVYVVGRRPGGRRSTGAPKEEVVERRRVYAWRQVWHSWSLHVCWAVGSPLARRPDTLVTDNYFRRSINASRVRPASRINALRRPRPNSRCRGTVSCRPAGPLRIMWLPSLQWTE